MATKKTIGKAGRAIAILALALALGIAACKRNGPPAPIEPPPAETTTTTQTQSDNVKPAIISQPQSDSTKPTAQVSEAETVADPKDPLFDPSVPGLPKAQLIEYINARLNFVREKKPAYHKEQLQTISKLSFSKLAAILNPIGAALIKQKMPPVVVPGDMEKSKDNVNDFLGMTAVFNIRPGDVIGVTAKKSGANYVVELKYDEETNAEKDGRGKYSRVFSAASRQDTLEQLKDALSADPNEATFIFRKGEMRITVDAGAGEIREAHAEFEVGIDAQNVTVKQVNLTVNLTAQQNTIIDWSRFEY